jgi:cellulose biosynthesis protein BcsQ
VESATWALRGGTESSPKTHSCTTIGLLNIALAFFSDKRVLLIDLDPQFTASQWLMEAEQWDQIVNYTD